MKAAVVAALLLALPLSGCLGFGADEEAPVEEQTLAEVVGEDTAEQIEARAAVIPRDYDFPDQQALPTVTLWKNGTISAGTAAAAYEDRNDRGGNRYGVVVVADDYASVIPPGQAVELRIKLTSEMTAGSSADLDIYVDVPGTRSDFDASSQDEFNWKFTSKIKSVSTVGVDGARHDIGVAVANAKIAPGSDLAYSLQVEVSYVQDVLTPHHPWALEVPPNATGLVFQAVKGAGPENVVTRFVVVDPADEPVGVVTLNDLSVSTVFVPVRGPGTYVFYAWEMTGGFVNVQADVPVPNRVARPLALVEAAAVDASAPAPGLPARDWTHDGGPATPGSPGGTASFSVTGTFPLRIVPTIGDGATAASEVRISSSLGLVASLQRVARYQQGEDSLGYTQDAYNSEFLPENLAKGEYVVEFVNDGPVEIGHVVVTYARS